MATARHWPPRSSLPFIARSRSHARLGGASFRRVSLQRFSPHQIFGEFRTGLLRAFSFRDFRLLLAESVIFGLYSLSLGLVRFGVPCDRGSTFWQAAATMLRAQRRTTRVRPAITTSSTTMDMGASRSRTSASAPQIGRFTHLCSTGTLTFGGVESTGHAEPIMPAATFGADRWYVSGATATLGFSPCSCLFLCRSLVALSCAPQIA